jgi:hypothetical protein
MIPDFMGQLSAVSDQHCGGGITNTTEYNDGCEANKEKRYTPEEHKRVREHEGRKRTEQALLWD